MFIGPAAPPPKLHHQDTGQQVNNHNNVNNNGDAAVSALAQEVAQGLSLLSHTDTDSLTSPTQVVINIPGSRIMLSRLKFYPFIPVIEKYIQCFEFQRP